MLACREQLQSASRRVTAAGGNFDSRSTSANVLLPEDQFHHIFGFLDVVDVIAVSAVCWQLNGWCRLCQTLDVTQDVGAVSLAKLLRLHPDVTDVTVRSAPRLSAAGYAAIAAVAPQLSRLRLLNARAVADAPLAAFARRNLSALTVLELSGTFFTRGPAMLRVVCAAPNLTALSLDGFRHLRDEDVSAVVAALPQLESLSVADCTALARLRVAAPALTALTVARCVHARALLLETPALTALDASTCTKLSADAVDGAVAACPALRRLVLRGCAGLAALRIASAELRELDLSCCGALASVALDCPRLARLSLDMCMALRSATLALRTIHTLDLSLLPVEALSIDAPELRALNLRSSYRLHDAGIRCCAPSLQLVDHCGTHITAGVFGGGARSVAHNGMLLQWMSN
ncbi:F-box and leucine rich repeat-containing protein [Tribonema minus]|uniref:F-box and leucine rich repeat-containing protein n=1 Tax=Tribonema minus TaxID=303371 RepID=A0A836CLB3_9STRA|nr:F-box and leucine rich repeat-containing protein [Tribonema minus]